MAATAGQRAIFAERLKQLRKASGMTQAEVIALLPACGGTPISDRAYSEYERALSAPSAVNAAAFEAIFDEPSGALAGLLGYRGDDPTIVARMDRIEASMDLMAAGVDEIRSLVRRLNETLGMSPGAPPEGDGPR